MNQDRRLYARIQKNLACNIYIAHVEYNATIVDISQRGIAFEVTKETPIKIGDKLTITVHEEYPFGFSQTKTYIGNVTGYITEITLAPNNNVRVGCTVVDENYTKYVQEQYIALACGVSFRT